MKKKYTFDDLFWVFMMGLFVMLTVILFFNTFTPNWFSSYDTGFQAGVNSTQQNITNAYYAGLTYWQTTGKLVYVEQDFTGKIQLKESTLEEVCKNG